MVDDRAVGRRRLGRGSLAPRPLHSGAGALTRRASSGLLATARGRVLRGRSPCAGLVYSFCRWFPRCAWPRTPADAGPPRPPATSGAVRGDATRSGVSEATRPRPRRRIPRGARRWRRTPTTSSCSSGSPGPRSGSADGEENTDRKQKLGREVWDLGEKMVKAEPTWVGRPLLRRRRHRGVQPGGGHSPRARRGAGGQVQRAAGQGDRDRPDVPAPDAAAGQGPLLLRAPLAEAEPGQVGHLVPARAGAEPGQPRGMAWLAETLWRDGDVAGARAQLARVQEIRLPDDPAEEAGRSPSPGRSPRRWRRRAQNESRESSCPPPTPSRATLLHLLQERAHAHARRRRGDPQGPASLDARRTGRPSSPRCGVCRRRWWRAASSRVTGCRSSPTARSSGASWTWRSAPAGRSPSRSTPPTRPTR